MGVRNQTRAIRRGGGHCWRRPLLDTHRIGAEKRESIVGHPPGHCWTPTELRLRSVSPLLDTHRIEAEKRVSAADLMGVRNSAQFRTH
jgi:hypothetical protein